MEDLIVWMTDSPINRTVTAAAVEGLRRFGVKVRTFHVSGYTGTPYPSLSYGVLRGTGRIYRDCMNAKVPWWNIDKGFFGAGHPLGFYRIGYKHLQPVFIHNRSEDPIRWRSLSIPLKSWKRRPHGPVLICPPEGICEFYGVQQEDWLKRVLRSLPSPLEQHVETRFRNSTVPLSKALEKARCVVTHSSNVAIEALVEGIPAIADTGFVRSWNYMTIYDAHREQDHLDREALCVQAANSQFTLREIESGMAWEMLKARGSM